MELSLVPVGHIEKELLSSLRQHLESLGFSVTVTEEVPIPETAYNPKRNQYLAYPFIEAVDVKGYHLMVTDVDLFTPQKNFIFGLGPGPNAIISLSRLKGDLLTERVIKEAVHELGHVFSLRHCDNPECVMYFSNTLSDTDYKQKEFCSTCQDIWESQHL